MKERVFECLACTDDGLCEEVTDTHETQSSNLSRSLFCSDTALRVNTLAQVLLTIISAEMDLDWRAARDSCASELFLPPL